MLDVYKRQLLNIVIFGNDLADFEVWKNWTVNDE